MPTSIEIYTYTLIEAYKLASPTHRWLVFITDGVPLSILEPHKLDVYVVNNVFITNIRVVPFGLKPEL